MSHKPVMLLVHDGRGINSCSCEPGVANGDATMPARFAFEQAVAVSVHLNSRGVPLRKS